MSIKWIRNLASLAVLAIIASMTPATFAGVENGKTAPGFELKNSHGKTVSLSDYKDKYVVLEWINHQCPFVKKHYGPGNMQSLQKQYTEKGVVWLSICSSAPGKQGHLTANGWMQAAKDHKMASTAVLLDEDGKVGKMYGAKTTPHMFIIAPDGNLIYQGAIDSIKSPRSSDISSATNYVAEALDAHMAGKEVPNPITKPYGCGVKY
ncbi:MAG: thioredoxin family protein [Phycisphaeraceae bacterium]|nr:thioredoxin family protein [Phycisphaeraceae bacterium]